MRHFAKGDSPKDFEEWKLSKGKSAKYKNIPGHIKENLRKSLSKEQSNLCCYCGISLKDDNIHIEHFKPQKHFPGQALNYQNLHASCMGKRFIPSDVEELDFCGHAKGDWYDENLLVSPLDPNCESYFMFGFDGNVTDRENDAVKETIKRLQLDTYLLRTQREEAINSIIDSLDLNDALEIKEYIAYLETPDENGDLSSFSFIIAGLLKTLV